MKFIDFFAGIGGFHSGLENAGHEMVGWVEWDKYARQSYEALYDTEGKYTASDIKSIRDGRELPSADLWAFGSPCTNISMAGNRVGLRGEQSAMFFEVIRLLNDRSWEEKPTTLLMENVKNLLSSNRGWDFATVINKMDEAGYDVEWEVFNSSWVVPQNRERVYIVGHKRGVEYTPVFPITRREVESRRKYNMIRDVLEQEVDDNFYLSNDKIGKLLVNDKKSAFSQAGNIKVVANASESHHRSGDILDGTGISKTLTASDYKHPVKVAMERESLTKTGNHNVQLSSGKTYTMRKLTPLECWRLQGFTDEQFNKARAAGVSNSQLYKQAGNAVTVPIVEAIGEKLSDSVH